MSELRILRAGENSTVNKVFTLHMADLDFIFGILLAPCDKLEWSLNEELEALSINRFDPNKQINKING